MKYHKKILKLIKRALEERFYILKISDVLGYAVGFREKNGKRTDEPVLIIYVKRGRKDKAPNDFPLHQRIPKQIKLKLKDDTIMWIGVDLIEESYKTELCQTSTATSSSTKIFIGDSIGSGMYDETGTIGWIARRRTQNNEPVICTNFHVLFPRKSNYDLTKIAQLYKYKENNKLNIISPGKMDEGIHTNNDVGFIFMAKRTKILDLAIIRLKNPNWIGKVPRIRYLGPIGKARIYREDELDSANPTEVLIRGWRPNNKGKYIKRGNITELWATRKFLFPDGRMVRLLGLIVTDIKVENGDSGALLFDLNRRPMGMLVGRSQDRSYFMHIGNIMNYMGLKDFN